MRDYMNSPAFPFVSEVTEFHPLKSFHYIPGCRRISEIIALYRVADCTLSFWKTKVGFNLLKYSGGAEIT